MTRPRAHYFWLLLAIGNLLFLLVACSATTGSSPSPTPVVRSSPGVLPTATMPPSLGTTVYLTYSGHSQTVYSVAWSPDGKRLASSSEDETVQVWDAASGKHLFTYHEQTPVEVVTWSPDNRRLASSGNDGTVQVWDALTGTHVFNYRGQINPNIVDKTVYDAVWSPDGTRIASCGEDRTVQVWQSPQL